MLDTTLLFHINAKFRLRVLPKVTYYTSMIQLGFPYIPLFSNLGLMLKLASSM